MSGEFWFNFARGDVLSGRRDLCFYVMDTFPHVALVIETSKQYGRELLRGIGRYVQSHGPWSVYFTERGESDSEPEWIRDWDGQGIITRSVTAKVSRVAQERGIAVVNLGYHRELAPAVEMPCINCDHAATGEMVAAHFRKRGFAHFAYCHAIGGKWSEDRRDAFVRSCEAAGAPVEVFDMRSSSEGQSGDWEEDQERLSGWVSSLPKPCAVMAAYDLFGARIIDACRRSGIRVPEEVAVVGVDNDPLICSVSWPPLSSVDQNVEEIGFQAARLLSSMMAGGAKPAVDEPILVPPKELVLRTSSDIFAFDDPAIAGALQFIRDHSGRPISVDEVAERAELSRRDLERRFSRQLDSSPYKMIQQERIKRVIRLLTHTDYTLDRISDTLGFSETSNMASLFKKCTGLSPGQYRRRHADG